MIGWDDWSPWFSPQSFKFFPSQFLRSQSQDDDDDESFETDDDETNEEDTAEDTENTKDPSCHSEQPNFGKSRHALAAPGEYNEAHWDKTRSLGTDAGLT